MGNDDIYIGSYRLISKLGSGAFGDVYKAQHAILSNRIVALKLMRPDYAENEEAITRFLIESQILEKLRHPYILPIISVDIHNGFPYQVTEYASKGSLRDRLQLQPSRPLPIAETITILSQVGQALQYAHDQNIIHRDLKPENILFNEKGDAFVADFGIATMLSTSSIKQTSALGTYLYMAPEEYQDLVCRESDQYALGCIAYELFTGRLPFQASSIAATIAKHLTELPASPRTYNPELPEHMAQAVLKALAKQRTERFTDISAFIAALITIPARLSEEAKKEWMTKLSGMGLIPDQKERLIAACRQAILLDSNFEFAYFCQGVALFDLKRYKEALAAFESAIRIEPNESLSWFYMSDLLKHFGKRDGARNAYEKAKELHKIEFGEEYGDEYDDSGELDDNEGASISFGQAGSDDSSHIEDEFKAYVNAGHRMYELHHYDESLAAYDRATKLDSGSALAFYGKGMSLSMLEHNKEAVSAFELATHINPNFDDAYNSMGIALYQLHYYSEALAAFEQVIRLVPGKIIAWLMKGSILLELGRYHEALAACVELIRLDPNSSAAFNMKGVSLDGLGSTLEAISAYEQAIRLDPNSAEAYNNIGNTFFQLTRYEEALVAFEEAIQLKPNFAFAYNGKGNVYLNLQQYNDALDAFEMAIELVPNYAEAYGNKGIVLTECGYYHEALLAFEQAMVLNPGNANVWRNKGKALFLMRHYLESLPAFERALQLIQAY